MNIVFMSMDTLPSTLWARDLYDQILKQNVVRCTRKSCLRGEGNKAQDSG